MTPFYDDGGVTIYNADCRALPFADGSVQTCVTSPPYWGLRDYGISELVWDADPDCDHVWGHELLSKGSNHVDKRRWNHAHNGRGEEAPAEKLPDVDRPSAIQGKFCQRCGAWAGSLGLEPTPELFVDHIVTVFREVRRVLRDDGTLWLNLGDSYVNDTKWGGASGGKNYTSAGGGYQGQRVKRECKSFRRDRECVGGDNHKSVAGLKPKDLVGIPWRVAFALQADGWYLRSDIIWHKPNPMPESVTDRPTKSHEYLFLLSKSARYYYDAEAIAEPVTQSTLERLGQPTLGEQIGSTRANGGAKTNGNMKAVGPRFGGTKYGDSDAPENRTKSGEVYELKGGNRNARTVWTIPTQGYPGAHFATFPQKLVEPCIKAGSRPGDTVLDPFTGSGTVAEVARRFGRKFVGTELSAKYCKLIAERLAQGVLFKP